MFRWCSAWLSRKGKSFHGEKGYALVAVIWLSGLLAVVATSLLATGRSQVEMAIATSENARLSMAADGMFNRVALLLVAASGDIATLKLSPTCRWNDDITLSVAVRDHGGLIDINTANPELLRALLAAVLPSSTLSNQALQDIQDFKDPDNIAQNGGPEVSTYAGLGFGPKNLPFDSILELDQVPGIPDGKLQALLKHLTTQSQSAGIDPSVSDPDLMALIKKGLGSGPKIDSFLAPSTKRVFSIEIAGQSQQGARFARHAVISLLLQPEKPFSLLEWRVGPPWKLTASPPAASQLCLSQRS
jgi:general secretion pathway protein K